MGTDYCIYKFKKNYAGREIAPNKLVSVCDFIAALWNSEMNSIISPAINLSPELKKMHDEYVPFYKKYTLTYDDYCKWTKDPEAGFSRDLFSNEVISREDFDFLFKESILKTKFDHENKQYVTWNDTINNKYAWDCIFECRSIANEGLLDWLGNHDYYLNLTDFSTKIDPKDIEHLIEDLRKVLVNHDPTIAKVLFPSDCYDYTDNDYYEMVLIIYTMMSEMLNKFDKDTEDIYFHISC